MNTLSDMIVSACRLLLVKVNRLLDIMEALLSTPPAPASWPEWQERATALLSQYETTLRDIRPALNEILLVPSVGGGPEHEMIPNVLLRTKLSPGVEEHLNRLNTNSMGGNKENAPLFKIMSQVLQETAECIRQAANKPPPASRPIEDEKLVRAVRQLYTKTTTNAATTTNAFGQQ